MQERKISAVVSILIVSAAVAIISAVSAWRLSEMPFGTLFNTFAYLALLGLFGSFAALAIIGLRSKSWIWKAAGALPAILALIVGLTTAALLIDYRIIPGAAAPEGLTSAQWIEDLHYLASQMEQVHPRLFEMVPRERFEAEVAGLEQEIPGLDENRIKWEMYRIAALPNDAHTFFNIQSTRLDWHLMPIKLWMFPDGLYVVDAGRDERDIIGSRLVAIENTSADEAYEKLRPYMAAESEAGWKERFCYLAMVDEALLAAGICDSPGPVEATFETDGGKRFTRTIKLAHYLPVFYWAQIRKTDNSAPYFLWNESRDPFLFDYRDETGTLYVQFNECVAQSKAETFDQFIERLGSWTDNNDFERCVIDIRKNGGGDSNVSLKMAGLFIGNAKLDRPGRLFVLTSRKTFSAAVMFLSLMECSTSAVIVGEATGQGPFFTARSGLVTLPNSKMEINVSRYYNRCALIDDGRDSIYPDIPVDYTYQDYVSGRDPMMEAVLSYQPQEPPAAIVPAEAKRISGRYSFSPYQLLTVDMEGEGLLRIDDFLEGSFRNVRTRILPDGEGRFLTDIAGVELVFDRGAGPCAGVTLDWRGVKTYAPRAPEGYREPMELLAEGKTEEAIEGLYDRREIYRAAIPDLEQRLNRIGYLRLRAGKTDDAVAVFELNVKLFPESSNTYDSLGEAYLKSGRESEAVKSYEKALELDPTSRSARDTLERLRKGS